MSRECVVQGNGEPVVLDWGRRDGPAILCLRPRGPNALMTLGHALLFPSPPQTEIELFLHAIALCFG